MTVTRPRAWLKLGDARIPVIQASVARYSRRDANTFAALLSINEAAQFGYGLAEWTDFDPQDAALIMASALDGGDERQMVIGKIDMPNVSLTNMTVSVSGRDKSASLTEKRRNEAFKNQKPKDIAGKIAADHGLSLSFTGGGEFSGKLYDQDTANLILNRTDFDVLSDLAEQIGSRWYVDADTLYVEPSDTQGGAYNVFWRPPTPGQPASANALDVALKRNMSAARPQKVRVKSWDHRSKKLYKGLAQVDGRGDPIEYQDHHSGKSQAQVDKLAKSRLKDAIRHELGVVVRAPGDLAVDVRQVLNLSGTGTIFDQAYNIDEVTFDIGWGEGLVMVVQATAAKQGRDPDGNPGTGAKPAEAVAPPLPPARPATTGAEGIST